MNIYRPFFDFPYFVTRAILFFGWYANLRDQLERKMVFLVCIWLFGFMGEMLYAFCPDYNILKRIIISAFRVWSAIIGKLRGRFEFRQLNVLYILRFEFSMRLLVYLNDASNWHIQETKAARNVHNLFIFFTCIGYLLYISSKKDPSAWFSQFGGVRTINSYYIFNI